MFLPAGEMYVTSTVRERQNTTRMWAIANMMAALPNIGGALC